MRSFLTHLFLPHRSNNHRPKVLHVDALSVYAVLLLLFYFGTQSLHKKFPNVLGYATNIYIEDLLKNTNEKRQESGLQPLALDQRLSEAAQKKAEDMFAKNYWAHYSPEGRKPWDFITESGYTYTVAGENLAKNFSDSKQVVDAWMASSSHRDNLLKASYRDIGFAIVNGVLNGEETTLVVQMFGNTGSPVAMVQPQGTKKSGLVTQPAAKQVEVGTASVFSGVTKNPLIDIKRLSRDIAFVFVGVLMGILAMDAWLIAKRRTVRVAGQNLAHMMFLGALLFILAQTIPGAVL